MHAEASAAWHRVAELTPRLRAHALVHRHCYRGQIWHVVQDPATGRSHRLSPAAYHIVGLLDGERTVDRTWRLAEDVDGDAAPTQDEVVDLLARLHAADLLQCDVPPDAGDVLRRYREVRRGRRRERFASPVSWRIRVLDPDRLLGLLAPLARPLLGRCGALAWLVTVAAAIVLAGAHWEALTDGWSRRLLDPAGLLALGLAYPVVKAIHEMAHGLAAKVWGAEIHDAGIVLIALAPLPYVDASGAAAFPEKSRRMAVGAAGIVAELGLAALALFAWLLVEPGLVRDAAFAVMFIGTVSSLAFNGNPLLRFDAYYVLADALEIPNLARRSARYVGYLFERRACGVEEARSPATAPGEAPWLLVYGCLAPLYRIAVTAGIVLLVSERWLLAGAAIALWALWALVVRPGARFMGFLAASPAIARHRARAVAATGALAGLLALTLFALPVPLATRIEGVVWPAGDAAVRAAADGFVRAALVPSGTAVRAGEPLFELDDPLRGARIRVVEARLAGLRARHAALLFADRLQAEIVADELAALGAELDLEREQARRLIVASPADGVFVVPDLRDHHARFVRQGEQLGLVVDRRHVTVRAVVPEAQVDRVRRRLRSVAVRLADRVHETHAALVLGQAPAATHTLPSPVLGSAGGGAIPVDAGDEGGVATAGQVFELELVVPGLDRPADIGQRVHIRVDHGAEPVARRLADALRRLLLRRLDV